MSEVVELDSLRDCLRAGLASPMATCGPDGMPHVTYLLQVRYLDRERVATARLSFNHALLHLDAGPISQIVVTRPGTGAEFRLDLHYLHTVAEGEDLEAMRANLDAVTSQAGLGPAFRLRGMDVHRVLRCTRVERGAREAERAAAPDPLVPLERFARRLERATSREEATREVIDALDDLFGFRYAVIVPTADVRAGNGLIGTAASRRRVVVTANLDRARAMAGDGTGDPRARSAAAVPLLVGDDILGVLYLESPGPSAFGGPTEALLRILGAHAAAALAARSPRAAPAPTPAEPPGRPPIALVYYEADDTILCDSVYVVKGAPGRILWSMLKAHASCGRTHFTNRELRLDASLELPAGNNNLEARLLVLRRRLAGLGCGVTLERIGRGRLELRLERPAELTEVPTGPAERTAAAARPGG